MTNHETPSYLAPGHNLWSPQRKRSEGDSVANLHFGVSQFGSLEATHSKRSHNEKS
jgi:hypothetical protein